MLFCADCLQCYPYDPTHCCFPVLSMDFFCGYVRKNLSCILIVSVCVQLYRTILLFVRVCVCPFLPNNSVNKPNSPKHITVHKCVFVFVCLCISRKCRIHEYFLGAKNILKFFVSAYPGGFACNCLFVS